MAAKYYIYRNLNRGGFSVKYKGLVVDRPAEFIATDVEFRVSKPSQDRARRQKSRNVHAYIVCDEYTNTTGTDELQDWELLRADPISYNPYYTDTFMCSGKPIWLAKRVIAANGKAYIPK